MEFDLICINCKHYDTQKEKCDAFPDGIPDEIWAGPNDHSEPLPKQGNNIVFEEKS